MAIYNLKDDQLHIIKEDSFKLERDIQRIFENNLELITGLKSIKSEFIIQDRRIDTLAFDEENRSFVIIEYKRSKNYGLIDQGAAYLNLMLQYKSDFILEYNETCAKNLNRSDVDWSQVRVIFVSPDFVPNQIQALNFKDLPIELWEVNKYENNIIGVNKIERSDYAPNIKQIVKENSKVESVLKETKVYTEDDLFNDKPEEIQELYDQFKNGILNLTTGIEIKPQKFYIAFKKDNRNITDIEVLKKSLKISINLKKGELDDAKNLARDVSNIGHLGNGDYVVQVSDDKNLEYILSLIKQAI